MKPRTSVLAATSLAALLTLTSSAQRSRAGSTADEATSPVDSPAPAVVVAWGDVDGDLRLDLLARRAESLEVYLQGSTGAFTLAPTLGLDEGGAPLAASLVDFDLDGFADVALLETGPRLRLLRNDGFLAFSDVTDELGLSEAGGAHHADWLDLDGDAWPDLLVVDAIGTSAYLNVDGRRFERAVLPAGLTLQAEESMPTSPPAEDGRAPFDPSEPGRAPERGGDRPALSDTRVPGRAEVAPKSTVAPASEAAITSLRAQLVDEFSFGACVETMRDQSGAGCINASSTPTLGSLYPISADLFVGSDGRIGLGTTSPLHDLHVLGDASASSVMIAPDVASSGGDADLFFAEDDDGTYGMRLVYDGGANELSVFGQQAGGASGPHLTVERDSGRVGVGTAQPSSELHVLGSPSSAKICISTDNPVNGGVAELWLSSNADGDVAVIQGFDAAAAQYHLRGKVAGLEYGPHLSVGAVDGRVGVGTTSPQGELHVQGGSVVSKVVVSTDTASPGGRSELWLSTDAGADDAMVQRYDASTQYLQVLSSLNGTEYGPHMSIASVTGRVGFHTSAPSTPFHVAGDSSSGSVTISPGQGSSNADAKLLLAESHSASLGMSVFYDGGSNQLQLRTETTSNPGTPRLVVTRDSGNVGIGTTSPTARLHVSGTVRAGALDIVAGADLVEGFETSDGEHEAGTVLVIDPEHAGRLRRSRTPYDRRVAGVVSGAGGVNHGIRLGQPGVDGDTLVAMTGRVWARATASGGPIRPGDRLTTSDLPGHTMRVSDDARAAGAVIGKAMTGLESGEGLVLVLVNLQ